VIERTKRALAIGLSSRNAGKCRQKRAELRLAQNGGRIAGHGAERRGIRSDHIRIADFFTAFLRPSAHAARTIGT
jgi:hypothetical protein